MPRRHQFLYAAHKALLSVMQHGLNTPATIEKVKVEVAVITQLGSNITTAGRQIAA